MPTTNFKNTEILNLISWTVLPISHTHTHIPNRWFISLSSSLAYTTLHLYAVLSTTVKTYLALNKVQLYYNSSLTFRAQRPCQKLFSSQHNTQVIKDYIISPVKAHTTTRNYLAKELLLKDRLCLGLSLPFNTGLFVQAQCPICISDLGGSVKVYRYQ